MKRSATLTLICLTVILAGAVACVIVLRSSILSEKLVLANQKINLEIVDTDAERAQGLSGRESLGANTAMLFVFDNAAQQCMWMKDMKFSIDMVWLDQAKRVVKIEKRVSPDTYPQAFCGDNTKYVLELNAGMTERSHLRIGQRINF